MLSARQLDQGCPMRATSTCTRGCQRELRQGEFGIRAFAAPGLGAPDGRGGSGPRWYDLGRPEVRDLSAMSCWFLKDYDVDGIHFDYIRTRPLVCRCEHCQREFSEKYGFDLGRWGGHVSSDAGGGSNPLGKPTTAKVLATFDSGVPAITMNQMGRGSGPAQLGAATSSCPRRTTSCDGCWCVSVQVRRTRISSHDGRRGKYRLEVQQGRRIG